MEQLRELLESCINEELINAVLSNPKDKEGIQKVKVRPVLMKGEMVFQCEEFRNNQAFHVNCKEDKICESLMEYMTRMRQMQIETKRHTALVLVSKKGKVTIKKKTQKNREKTADLSHNRKKQYILEEGIVVPFLQDLGVMTEEGKIVRTKFDKFRQINRFLEFIEDILPKLHRERENRIIDFGCGKSYLTFAMYHYLKIIKGYSIHVVGLDLKKDVIGRCNMLAEKYGYDRLSFYCGDIADYEGVEQADMVVTLHACDTATDYALEKAVRWGAKVILSVPCCQHELNRQIKNDLLKPVLGYGIIKERMAALITDALRAELLEAAGYRTQILEFIEMEHTPKNLLIRAVKEGKPKENQKELDKLMEFLQVNPAFKRLLSLDE